MDEAEDLYLRCHNFTEEQYNTIILSRGITAGVGLLISIVMVLVIVMVMRRKACDNPPKRFTIQLIFSTAVYMVVAIISVKYSSHNPLENSRLCEISGFFLHYTGSVMIVNVLAAPVATLYQVITFVFPEKTENLKQRMPTCCKASICEGILHVLVIFCPLVDVCLPLFLHDHLPSYGSEGPWCWFQVELNHDCSTNKTIEYGILYLWGIPFEVLAAITFSALAITTALLCGVYCKFYNTRTAENIKMFAPKIALILAVGLALLLGFAIAIIITTKNYGTASASYAATISDGTSNLISAIVMLTLIIVYVYLPSHYLICKCLQWRAYFSRHEEENVTVRRSLLDHRAIPHYTWFDPSHETVTTIQA